MTVDELPLEPVVDPSGWFSVQLRYAYLVDGAPIMIEDRVVLVDGEDEETALGHAIEVAEEYEDEFETDTGDSGVDDPPATGTEVWHDFMAAAGVEASGDGEPLPVLRPTEMAFPRAHDD